MSYLLPKFFFGRKATDLLSFARVKQKSLRGRVLVLDEDIAFIVATRELLGERGLSCTEASSVSQSRELIASGGFDLLITELQTADGAAMSLIEATPELAPGMPVIVVTATPTVESAAKSVGLPVTAYLVKPAKPDELLAAVDRALNQFRVFQAVRRSRDRLDSWLDTLRQLETLISRPSRPTDANATSVQNFVNLTLSNLLASLLELKQFAEAITHPDSPQSVVHELVLYRALQETVVVLERTKQSFKSKELGELRRRLERVLQTQSQPSGELGP